MKENSKEFALLITGFLTAVMGFLATLNIKYDWLTGESITAFGAVIVALIVLIGGCVAAYKNTFVITKKAKRQKAELKRKGLK